LSTVVAARIRILYYFYTIYLLNRTGVRMLRNVWLMSISTIETNITSSALANYSTSLTEHLSWTIGTVFIWAETFCCIFWKSTSWAKFTV